MAIINLNEKTLPKIVCTDKLVYYWDTNLRGFGISAKGRNRHYIVKGRVHGKQVMFYMDKVEHFESVKSAREEAREILAKMTKGVNPKREKEAKQKAEQDTEESDKDKGITLGGILESYLAERPNLKDSTRKFYRLMLDTYLEDWKDRPIREIDYMEVKARHLHLSKKVEPPATTTKKRRVEKKKVRRNGPGVADSAMKALRVLFQLCHGRISPKS